MLAIMTHSTTAEDTVLYYCSLEYQTIGLFPKRYRLPKVDLQSLGSFAQSESAYAVKTGFQYLYMLV